MTEALRVDGLRFAYGRRTVLEDVSFSIAAGEAVGIVGANGSGKSTLLWAIAGLLRAGGRVTLEPGSRIGMVFQNPEDQLFMPAVRQDLALPLINDGMPAPMANHVANEGLRAVGLDAYGDEPAAHLSLGQRKRAAIALALARKPELLLLDEPTAELDGRAVRQLVALLGRIQATRVVASHHLEFLRQVTTRTLVLAEGRILADGETGAILGDAALMDRAGLA